MDRRIGLFGGTFNPIHLGHITLAQKVFADFNLDELILIPAKLPPHKEDITGATTLQRYEMVRLAAGTIGKGVAVSDYELKTDGISYSYRTVSYLSNINPGAALFFIAGSDIFITIETWQRWREIFNFVNFIVVSREGVSFDTMLNSIPSELHNRIIWRKEYKGELSGKIILYDMDTIAVSSTKIRGCTAEGGCREMLPKAVYDYIVDNNLYV